MLDWWLFSILSFESRFILHSLGWTSIHQINSCVYTFNLKCFCWEIDNKLATNFPPALYTKDKFEKKNHKNTHQSHTYIEFMWFGNMPMSTGCDPVCFFTIEKIEYNGISLNRLSLISQTQALNPLYTPLNYPSQIPSKEKLSTLCKCHKVLSQIFPG